VGGDGTLRRRPVADPPPKGGIFFCRAPPLRGSTGPEKDPAWSVGLELNLKDGTRCKAKGKKDKATP